MSHLSLSLLGPFQIALDGKPVMAGLWAKTQALLAYLAAEADTYHRRESLAGLIWPDQPEEAARHSLRQSLFQLRHAIGEGEPPFLCITPQAIQFNAVSDHWLDVNEFIALIGACAQHAHRHAETCCACVKRLEHATTLYRGDLLADFFLKDSAPFEEWAIIKREQLARLVIAALHTLAEHYAIRSRYVDMEWAARRQIEIDPFRESAHRQLMLALMSSGQRNAALSHYAALTAMLAKELGIAPDKETRALYTQIEADTLPTLQSPLAHPRHNWPAQAHLTSFVGREHELDQVVGCLQMPGARLVTLTGPGGIGKTRLALRVAEQAAYAFRDGVFFVPLSSIPSPEFIAPAIADALRISLDPAGDPKAQLLNCLRESNCEFLLVLDSLEPLTVAAPFVTDMLAAGPALTLLVTSRGPLHIGGEQVLPVPPFELPDLTSREFQGGSPQSAVLRYPAVSLFVDRAQAVRHDFCITPGNAMTIAAICARLDGLPLAIELAAAHVRLLAPQTILERLDHRLDLVGDPPDLDPRHTSLRDMLDCDYARLNPDERKLFARLAVFAHGPTLEEIQSICGEVDSKCPTDWATRCDVCLEALLDKSLLQRQEIGEEIRFTMLETIREYALERLAESGEADLVLQKKILALGV